MLTNTELHGSFPDVAFFEGSLYVSYPSNERINVSKFNGTSFELFKSFDCEGSAFARLREVNGHLYLIYRLQNGQNVFFRDLITGEERHYTGTFYNWPVVLGPESYAVNNIPVNCDLYGYDGTHLKALPFYPGTGLARIDGLENIISWDYNNSEKLTEYGIHFVQYADELMCGNDSNGGVGVICNNIKKVLNPGTNTFMPRIIKYGDRWAIVTTDYINITFFYDISIEDIIGVIPPINNEIVVHAKSGQIVKVIID